MAGTEPKIVVKGTWAWAADRLGIPPWGQILIGILAAATIVLFPLLWSMHSDIAQINGKLTALPVSISQDLLTQAKDDVSARNISRALRAVESAQNLLMRSKAKGVPASSDDFVAMIADLNILSETPTLSNSVEGTRIVLANYKSALIPIPKFKGAQATVEKSIIVSVEASTVDQSTLPGSTLIAAPGTTFDMLTTPFFRRLNTAPSVTRVGFMNAHQELDGWRWHDVAFVNSIIRYEGGELELNNTRFIHCTFQMSDSPRSAKLANYIALGQTSLKIGPSD